MPNAERRNTAAKRTRPGADTGRRILEQAGYRCAWNEGGVACDLKQGGGTVRLTPDHKTPHSLHAATDPHDSSKWQPLCGRHQVMKKNYWDDETGWLNVVAIVQSASEEQKQEVFRFLSRYFGDHA